MKERTQHIAIVSLEAVWHLDFDPDKPCMRQFVDVPEGYVNGPFTLTQFEHGGRQWCAYRFELWEKSA